MKKSRLVVEILMLFLNAIAALGMLLFALIPAHYNHILVGLIFMLGSFPHLVIFMLGNRFKDPLKVPDFVFFVVSILIGTLFLFLRNVQIEALVIIWGIYDLTRAAYHMLNSVVEFKDNKLEVIEMVGDVTEIAFSILLLFELQHGIKLHLIVCFATLLLCGTKFLIDLIVEINRNKKQTK